MMYRLIRNICYKIFFILFLKHIPYIHRNINDPTHFDTISKFSTDYPQLGRYQFLFVVV